MANIAKISPGDTLYDVQGRGTRKCWYPVNIVKVNKEDGFIEAYWNGNSHIPPTRYSDRRLKRLRAKMPNF